VLILNPEIKTVFLSCLIFLRENQKSIKLAFKIDYRIKILQKCLAEITFLRGLFLDYMQRICRDSLVSSVNEGSICATLMQSHQIDIQEEEQESNLP
jgi:hypothetical protein